MPAPENPPNSDEKRARILLAARDVAEVRGVSTARMEEVAARAGVSKGTLYRFFQSKEDLFLAMLISSYEEGLRLVEARVEAGVDPATGLARYFDGLVKVLATVSARMNVHYQAWGVIAGDTRRKERLFGFLRAFHTARAEEVQTLVENGQANGDFTTEANARSISDAVGALLSGFLYRSTFDPMGASPEALRACFAAVIEGPLASGRRADPGSDTGARR
jgi:AcrR family transcriptional regulator